MLNNVPAGVASAARNTVLLHPNSFECSVWRKHVKRVEAMPISGLPSTMGGAPTLGGMGVLKSEDEADFEYLELGPGKLALCGIYQPTSAGERDNFVVPANSKEALVESIANPGTEGYFVADASDLVIVSLGFGIVIGYTVEDVLPPIGFGPFSPRKLVIQPRDDMRNLVPFIPEVENDA